MNSKMRTPEDYYIESKNNAKNRGIEFLMTFEEWWEIWDKSGKWELRGKKKGEYVMGRNLNKGAYEKGNVSIIPMSENIKLSRAGRKPTLGLTGRKYNTKNSKNKEIQTNVFENAEIQAFKSQIEILEKENEYLKSIINNINKISKIN